MHLCTIVDTQCNASVSDEFPIQAPATAALQLHSALADGPQSDYDNPKVYIRHKYIRQSSHQKITLKKKTNFLKKTKILPKKNGILLVFHY